jgi:hypothetical protein
MSSLPLLYISDQVDQRLQESIRENLTRYLESGFADLSTNEGWAIPLSLKVDLTPLTRLSVATGSEAEVFNSLQVWQCLSHMTPSLANEGRIWTRLCHVEGLAYARARWIGARTGEDAEDAVTVHFFGHTRTRRRDDNAIGRLWWNAYIARQAMPGKHHEALKTLLKTADVRSNIVERAWMTSRPSLAGAVLRAIIRSPVSTATEDAFRRFMKTVNRNGGGMLFEAMSSAELDSFVDGCLPKA